MKCYKISPVRKQTEAVGHAVRAVYLYSVKYILALALIRIFLIIAVLMNILQSREYLEG